MVAVGGTLHAQPKPLASTSNRVLPRASRAVYSSRSGSRLDVRCQSSDAGAPEPSEQHNNAGQLLGTSRRKLIQMGMATPLTSVACACCGPRPAFADDWNYGQLSGPATWSGVCAAGAEQSPVDLPIRKLSAFAAPTGGLPPAMSAAASLPAVPTLDTPGSIARKVSDGLRLGWGKSEKVVVSNTGHGTMQVNFGPGNTAVLDGRDLELLQFHFHTPSEHAVNGVRFPMEVHFVHRDKSTGGLAVLGVMMEGGGKENKTFGLALRYAPEAPGARADCPIPLDSSLLLPSAAQPANSIVAGLNSILDTPAYFVHYPGSLTTPPCSEKVQWYVMLDTIKVSDSQILNFMKYVGAGKTYSQNSRPVQPINGRPFEVL